MRTSREPYNVRDSVTKWEAPIETASSPVHARQGGRPGDGSREPAAVRILTATCLLAISVLALVIYAFAVVQTIGGQGERDIVPYWAAGQLLVRGEDPYDTTALLKLERSAGWKPAQPEIVLNPPSIFFLLEPLGFVSVRAAAVLWLILLSASLAASIRMLWIVFGRPRSQIYLLCLCFAPVVTCLAAEQVGIYLLLGISLFLYLQVRRPFFAGAGLLVCALKPHLFLPFAVVLILWTMYRKQYRLAAGTATAVFSTCAIALYLDPHAFSQYAHMVATQRLAVDPVAPTLSKMLRLAVYPEGAWLQFLPAIVGCGWAAWYFVSHRKSWDWMRQGLLVLLVSVGCAPFAWLTDESVLIPAILAGLYRAQQSRRSLLPFAIVAGIALVELFKGFTMVTPSFVWTVPAWLGWYLYASRPLTVEK